MLKGLLMPLGESMAKGESTLMLKGVLMPLGESIVRGESLAEGDTLEDTIEGVTDRAPDVAVEIILCISDISSITSFSCGFR